MISPFFSPGKVLLFLLSLSTQIAAAQEPEVLGQLSDQELKLKECAFDKSADAVILLDKASSYFDEQYRLITQRHIKLKILKEKGVSRGNIRIPYYSANDFEYISGIKAVVTTPEEDGTISTKTLESRNIFNKKLNRLYSEISFALPNVKVGSIIDYMYESTMKSYAGLKNWEFQGELPVLASSYELRPIPNSEFAYTVYKKSEYPISINNDKVAGKVRFEMFNIPGIRDEVYTTTPRNYLQRVNFQFASFKDYYGKRSYTSTWQELSRELLNESSFGSQVNKNLSSSDFLKSLSPAISAQEKLKAIYEFVRHNIVWDHIYSKYSEEGVKNVLEKKKGNSADINLLLVSLLKSAGLEAYPLLVSERHHGVVDTAYSYLDQFNKVVAYVVLDNRTYVLDGTDQHTPYFMVPPSLLNTIGFLVDKKKGRFVYFNNLPHKQSESIFIQAKLQDDGTVEGTASVTNAEYAKLYSEQQYKASKTNYINKLLKPHSFLTLDSFSVEGIGNDSAAMVHQLKFHYELKKTGGYYLLNYNLFTGLNENPFITQHRFTDIDFGTRYKASVVGIFYLPASLVPETLPANKRVVSADKSLSVSRLMELRDNQLHIRIVIDFNKESYPSSQYDMIKEYFKSMIELLNEPVLLKSK